MRPLLFIRVGNLSRGIDIYDSLRPDEIIEFYSDCTNLISNNTNLPGCYVMFDNRPITKMHSILNLVKITMICIVLSLGSYAFYLQINKIVLNPLKKIIENISLISKNPSKTLEKLKEEKLELRKKEEEKRKRCCCNQKDIPAWETKILDKYVLKMCDMLGKGLNQQDFQMYNEIVTQKKDFLSQKDFYGIYCVCDYSELINHFNVFNKHQIDYLNEVEDIIESITAKFKGYSFPFTGLSMLLIWEISDETKRKNLVLNCFADKCMITVIKIIFELTKLFNNYTKCIDYKDPIICFGLSYGWSLQGVINSPFKIEKQFLGKKMNNTNHLKDLNKTYGTKLLYE